MFIDYLPLLYSATLLTLGLAVSSLVVGLILSMLFVVLEASKFSYIRKPSSLIITLLRGLPEIIVVLLIYFGSTEIVEKLTGQYVEFSAFWCGVVALAIIFASYASQSLRGAIQAIPLWRHALPGLSNQWLVLLKDTALVSLIGVHELMRQSELINTVTHQPFTWYGTAALLYLAITLVSQFFIRKLELRVTRFERGIK